MSKKILLLLLTMMSVAAFGQERRITGTVVDRDSKEPVVQCTVQLLQPDSTFVAGVLSNDDGQFAISAPKDGKYILKLSSVGFTTKTQSISLSGKDLDLGTLSMNADAIMLKGAQVTAQAAKVTVKKDTFVYNASAYRTPEGSVVEELVKKLPGAQVDDDGKITINGKEVKKILVDGKEFMTGDTKTAMKNLPTSIINNIKAYDQRSDLSRITGIDDGNEETVLDFTVKPGMNKGTFANIDLSVGTKDRYAERVMGAYFANKWRLMGFLSANNTNDMGFPGGGGGGRWGGRNGLNASKMVGLNFNYEDKDRLKWDASVRWNHGDGDVWSNAAIEQFNGDINTYENRLNQNYSRSNNWNANMRIEWQPDTMTTITFRPRLQLSSSDGRSNNFSRMFNNDPYLYVADPLGIAVEQLAADSIVVNQSDNGSISYSDNTTASAMLQLNRKLNSNGRNVTLVGNYSYGDSENKNLSTSDVVFYLLKNAAGNDSTYYTNRYNLTPTKNWRYSVQATYSEPLWKRTYLQFSYQFSYNYNKSDRATYDFSEGFTVNPFSGIDRHYRGWDNFLSQLPTDYTNYRNSDLSRFSEYKNYIHEMNVMFRMIRDKYRLNVGVMFQPQKSKFIQDFQGQHTDTVRNVFNVTPTLDFRYNPNDLTELRLNYRGSTSQPSMSDLLDITDDSDKLNIKKGNPGLKPSFTNNLRLFYNTYLQSHQRSIMTFANYSSTRNSIANRVTFNPQTYGTETRPENINGNWNAGLGFMFNTAIDSAGVWNANTFTMLNHNNYVGYLYKNKASVKNTTRTTSIMERLQGSYRKDWLEVALDGSFNYMRTRNLLQSNNNLDTWQFAYGGSINIYAPWGTSISTDLHNQSRRGYNDSSMNTNELIWNAQVSQSFLKGNALTVSLQFYDILHEQSNYSRTINAMQRSDTEYNSINSYAMLHVTYRFNAFGGNQAQMMRGPGGRNFGGRRQGGGFGGGRPGGGGFGGGRRW